MTAPAATTDSRIARVLAALAVLLALAPIVVATARGIHGGWLPIGDNAFFEVRARDVLTAHHPLVGTWTSASTSVGIDINNPGPLFFDLLALPVKVGGPSGLAVGVAIVNGLSILGIAVVARRRAGAVGTAAAMVMAAGLAWAMGSELLYDPWQPNSLLLPFLFLLTLTWAAFQGDLVALPWFVGVASLIVQTHFSYAVLVALLAAATVVALVVTSWRPRRRELLRSAAVAALVGVACWLQPLIDQFDPDGHGNLLKLLTHAGGAETTIGADLGVRLVASILALPPFWGRPSYEKGLVLLGESSLPTVAVAVAVLGLLAAVLVAALVISVRRRDPAARAAAALGLLATFGALATAAIIPLGVFAVAPHQLRWLWPIATFVTFALLLGVARLTTGRVVVVAPTAVLTGLVAVLAVVNLPTYNARSGPTADAAAIPAVRRLIAQLGPLEGKGPVLLDVRGLRFAEPYSLAVMAALQRRGVEFRVDESGMIHQLGKSRAADGTEPGRLVQRDREEAFVAPPGGELVARVQGLTPAERRELARLRTEVSGYIEDHGIRLNAKGRSAVAIGALADFGPADHVLRSPEPFVRGDGFVLIVRRRLAPIDPAWRGRIERYVDLLEEWQDDTVALYWIPST